MNEEVIDESDRDKDLISNKAPATLICCRELWLFV